MYAIYLVPTQIITAAWHKNNGWIYFPFWRIYALLIDESVRFLPAPLAQRQQAKQNSSQSHLCSSGAEAAAVAKQVGRLVMLPGE